MTEVYEKLRERLDMFPQGFPKTQSGIELDVLKDLFTVEEAEIALSLKPYPEPVAVVAERMDRDEPELGPILYDMSKKGLILRFKESEIMGNKCDKLLEACMTFGLAADYYIENGLAREISKEEARQILAKAEEDGLVHCSSNHKGEKIFICNCCGCHCKALAFITKHNKPGLIAHSNYYAEVDADTCEGCETCTDRCQVGAIEMEDGVASITYDACIGCGLCVSTCPTGSISMVHKLPGSLSHIFADDNELMQARAKDTGKVFPFE